MDTTWNELNRAVTSDPATQGFRRLLEHLVRRAFSILTRGSRRELQGLARKADAFARMCAPPLDDAASLRIWYGGQIQMIAALCRIGLASEISNEVMRVVRSRTHAQRVLAALRHREVNMTTLANELAIDQSQLTKLVNKLEKHDLIESAKDDKNRWLRLTPIGERAAVIDAEHREPEPEEFAEAEDVTAGTVSASEIEVLVRRLNDVTQDMERMAPALEAMEHLGPAAGRFAAMMEKIADVAAMAGRRQVDSRVQE